MEVRIAGWKTVEACSFVVTIAEWGMDVWQEEQDSAEQLTEERHSEGFDA
jgi:hypothetical protein